MSDHPVLQPFQVHPFDIAYGVDTSGLIWGEQLNTGTQAQNWATGYYGISPSVFWQALDWLRLEWQRFTFVDIGSGKGRALMLASRYSFQCLMGVELSPDLARAAELNLRHFRAEWRRSVPVHLIIGDAADFEFPSDPLVLFIYHPFGIPVLEKLLRNLELSLQIRPRDVYILYVNPEYETVLENSAVLEKIGDTCFPLTNEEIAVDCFGSHDERVVAYCSRQL